MDDGASGASGSQQDKLAARWTKHHRTPLQPPEEEIIYLHLPSPTNPGKTYIFPLALCPNPLPERKLSPKPNRNSAWGRITGL
jgi:hypothetical protein